MLESSKILNVHQERRAFFMAEYENTISATLITGSAEADSIFNSGATVTINALAGDDTIDNSGNNVTINAGADDDSIDNTGSDISISGGTGNNYINVNEGTGVTVNVASGYDTIYIGNDVSSITVKDFGANDEIQLYNTVTDFSTISGGVKADDVTIAGLTAATSTQKWSGKTKYIETITKGATLSSYGNSILYTPASENTLFTISGLTSTANVTVDTESSSVTVGAAALTTSNVSINNDYTLALGDDVEAPTTTSGWISVSGNTYAYKDISTIAGYELNSDNTQIIYTPATDGATLVQLSGLKSEPYIDGNNIMLSADNFSSNVTVNSNANGYAFNLEDGNYSKKSFTGTANVDTILNDGSSISINGGAGDDSIINSGLTVTISGGAGNDSIENSGNSATIYGGDDDDYILNSADNISINSGAGANSIDLDSGSDVTINVASGNDTIKLGNVTSLNVQNFSAGDAILLSKPVESLDTISAGITADNVTINGITSLSATTNQFSLKSGVATYYQKVTEGATLNEDNDAIIYTAASTSNLFTISGVTSTVGIDVDDTIVTVSKSALTTSNVSISSNDYSLALGDDVSSSTVANTWIQSGTTYAYKINTTVAGYELDRVNNVINYTAAKDGTTVIELTNINISDNAPTVSTDSAKISLSADSFSAETVSVKSNSGNYGFELSAGEYSQKNFSGSSSADSIYNDGSALSINASAGDDSINNESNGSQVSISGGAGNDSVTNAASDVIINGDAGADYIHNISAQVSINGGADNDSITNAASDVIINGDAGADYIHNIGAQVSINGGAGNDSIYNDADNVTISAGAGDDSISLEENAVNNLIQYSGGNDTITGFASTDTLQIVSGSIASAYSDSYNAFLAIGKNTLTIEDLSTTTNQINVMDSKGSVSTYTISLVKGTSANDTLQNAYSNVTIDALAGNDSIDNFASSVTISGGADNDSINNYYSEVSINGDTGDDLINIAGGNDLTVNVSSGNDTISLSNSSTSIKVEGFSSGKVILFANSVDTLDTVEGGITAGDVTISSLTISIASITSAWSLSGSNANYIEKYSSGLVLSKNEKSITYKDEGEESTLFTVGGVKDTAGLALNDSTIVVSSAALDEKNVTVNNNYILSLGSDVQTPEFTSEGWFKYGNNYAYKTSSTVTAGYQTVSSFEIDYFAAGEGSTLVELSGIGSEPVQSGNVITLSQENFSGNVAVVQNANNYAFNLNGTDYAGKTFTATSSPDTITNSGSNIEIQSGRGDDSIENSGDNVTVNAGAGNDSISNYADEASINGGTGNDSIYNEGGTSVTIDAGAGSDTITNNADNMLVQFSGGNDIIDGFNDSSTLKISSGAISSAYLDGSDAFITVGEDIITLKNLTSNKINLMSAEDTVSHEYLIPLILGTDEADSISNINSNLTIQALGADDTINNSGSSVTVSGGTDNDFITNFSDATKSLLLGQAGNDTLSNDADNVTISGGPGQDSIQNTGSAVSINGGSENNSIALNSGDSVTINAESGNDTVVVSSNISSFAVQSFNEGDRIELEVAASELTNIDGGIKIDDERTIKGLTATNVTNEWSLDSGVATYYQSHNAGVVLTDDNKAIVYSTVTSTSDIFTISGVTSTDGITVDDDIVTVSKSALGTSNVSISEGYFLALGDDVASPESVDKSWHMDGTTATYRDASTLAGYTLDVDNNKIIYSAPNYGETFVELSGVSLPNDGEDVISGNTIMLTADNFVSNVTVTNNNNGYDFELSEADYSGKSFIGTSGNDYINNNGGYNIVINSNAGSDTINNYGSSATISTGKGNDSVYTWNSVENVKISTGAGSDTVDNAASYATIIADAGNDSISNTGEIVSISGGAGSDYIYNTGEEVTINAGTGNDTIELSQSNEIENRVEYSSGDGDNVIIMSNTKFSVDLLSGTIGGYSTTEENDFVVQVDDGSLTFKNASGEVIKIRTAEGENYIWNGVSYTTIGGGDEVNIIENKGTNVTVQSGKGNDTVTLNADEFSTDNVYEHSKGKGKDVVYNLADTDKIRITDNSKVKGKIKDDDLILRVGTSSVTLKDAFKNQQMITVVNSDDETILSGTYTTDGKINEDGSAIELAEKFKGTYTAENLITTVDGSSVLSNVKIIGNTDSGNSLIGGRLNDTLEGATSNDTLSGGKGSDVFVYKGGSDVITDYEKRDKVRLENDSPTVIGYDITDNDLTLNFGSDSLTIADGAGKVLSLVEGRKTTRNIYTEAGTFDSKQKSVSLSGSQSVFSAARYSKLISIDGSQAEDYLNITGNNKKNYIIAGKFGGTVSGGKGKDTLIASEGSDVFIYSKGDGKDIIESYDAGDVVSLGSNVEIKDARIKSGDSVIKVASGSITINDTTTATLISDGNEITFNNGAFIDKTNSVVKVYGSYKDNIELSTLEVNIADASEARRKLTITSNDSANSITGGRGADSLIGGAGADSLVGGKGKDSLWGGAGNDTLAGGKGNDLLYGGEGSDTFIFTVNDGVDTVASYESGELLSIINKRGREVDVSKTVFNESKGTLNLSVKGGGKLILTGVTSSTSVNINGTSKTISAL